VLLVAGVEVAGKDRGGDRGLVVLDEAVQPEPEAGGDDVLDQEHPDDQPREPGDERRSGLGEELGEWPEPGHVRRTPDDRGHQERHQQGRRHLGESQQEGHAGDDQQSDPDPRFEDQGGLSRLFAGFGRHVLAPVAGTVVAAVDHEPDHAAHRGLASVSYALTQRRRLAEGWPSLAGNHVVIEAAPGRLVALCHLRQGTLDVAVGQAVAAGDLLAECGNSGNSTEPHVHLQAFDRIDVTQAVGLPISFPDGLPANGQIIDA
jgi:murein DD-endopeptidase MepM/ murein hydrolase activator NlpD